jgi:hypothetical protein
MVLIFNDLPLKLFLEGGKYSDPKRNAPNVKGAKTRKTYFLLASHTPVSTIKAHPR